MGSRWAIPERCTPLAPIAIAQEEVTVTQRKVIESCKSNRVGVIDLCRRPRPIEFFKYFDA